jgi:hypothetical protein
VRSCIRCSGRTIGLGSRNIVVVAIDSGRLTRSAASAPRLRCGSCGHVFVDRSATGESVVLDAVVDAALCEGISGAARRFACDERTIRSVVRRWTALREDEIVDSRTKELALYPVRAGGIDRLLVCDPDDLTLLDVLPGADDLEGWLSTRPGRTDLVLVPVDPAIVPMVEKILPNAVLAVAPSAARAAILSAAARTLHEGEGRRNFREDITLLPKADDDLTETERDEIGSFWSAKAKGLRRHMQALSKALSTGREAFEKCLTSVTDFLDTAFPRSGLGRLLSRWNRLFAAGAGEMWLDAVHARLVRVNEAVARDMPRASFELLRIALVFPDRGRTENGTSIDALLAASGRWCSPRPA